MLMLSQPFRLSLLRPLQTVQLSPIDITTTIITIIITTITGMTVVRLLCLRHDRWFNLWLVRFQLWRQLMALFAPSEISTGFHPWYPFSIPAYHPNLRRQLLLYLRLRFIHRQFGLPRSWRQITGPGDALPYVTRIRLQMQMS